jgi:hypothetical protein
MSACGGLFGKPPNPSIFGDGPSGTTAALVIVVSEILRFVRFSHGVAVIAVDSTKNRILFIIAVLQKKI